ncbi:MAG: hypothetical protein KC505_00645 [Myxococcales bacterium]|nr:hypothetical protein [Myxococcales bacterium]USN51457.1 MAG: hypothetical protein H6731_03350 [Myxococcales bacterium]
MNIANFHRQTLFFLFLFLANFLRAQDFCEDQFTKMWTVITEFLNEEYIMQPEITDESRHDLFATYKSEIDTIEKKWNTQEHDESNKELFREKNNFFAGCIKQNNNSEFPRLELFQKNNYQNFLDHRSIAQESLQSAKEFSQKIMQRQYEIDPTMQIGFCFARALHVHYLLRKAGIEQQDIFKVFALGDLYVDGRFWGFHVAIVIRDHNAGYLVIDPMKEELSQLSEWMKWMEKFSLKYPASHLRFYIADARKLFPSSKCYSMDELRLPHLKEYFFMLGCELLDIKKI